MSTASASASCAPGAILHGFECEQVEELPRLGLTLLRFRHGKTGARLVHLRMPVEERTFCLAFRTLPGNHTGVAHILEHCVLEGSRDYPLHLFKHLPGKSLFTFLNAMTSNDRTVYPFATPDPVDYRHLMDCYLDACFHPLLEEETFLQEGWRLEFEKPDDPATPLVYRGVVYNEMKAALSDPAGWLYRGLRRKLLPDLVYGKESGGIPLYMPSLGLQQLRNFHKRYYHPSNSWCITSGDFDPAEILPRLNEVYGEFRRRREIDFPRIQPPLGREKRAVLRMPVAAGQEVADLSTGVLAWRLGPTSELQEMTESGFLMEVLSGNAGAPLSRALLESRLGTGLSAMGLDSWGAQSWFSCGLKGLPAKKLEAFRDTVMGCLENLAEKGLDPEAVQAVLDRWEYRLLDQEGGSQPWGLGLGSQFLNPWMQGADPAACLRGEELFEKLRQSCRDPRFLPSLIRRLLLDNPERLLLLRRPQPGGLEREIRQEKESLARRHAALDESGRQDLVSQAARVEAYRKREDDQSLLPSLDLGQLSRELRPLHHEQRDTPWPHAVSRQASKGITLLRLAFPLDPSCPGADWLGLLPRLAFGGRDLPASARRIQSLTGRLGLSTFHSLDADGRPLHRMLLGLRCLDRKLGDCAELLQELLLQPDLEDRNRLRELTGMIQGEVRSGLIRGGGGVALAEARRRLSPLGEVLAREDGIESARGSLALDPEGHALGRMLAESLPELLQGPREIFLCGSEEALREGPRKLAPLIERLGQPPEPREPAQASSAGNGLPRAWHTDLKGAFVAECLTAPGYEHEDAPRLFLLCRLLNKRLYTRIRAEGGAYGSRASYHSDSGTLSFLSWRDPRVAGTLRDYAACRAELCAGAFDGEELREARIEALRSLQGPYKPLAAGNQAFVLGLLGRSERARLSFRLGILDAGRDELVDCARRWLGEGQPSQAAVISSRPQLEAEIAAGFRCEMEAALPEEAR